MFLRRLRKWEASSPAGGLRRRLMADSRTSCDGLVHRSSKTATCSEDNRPDRANDERTSDSSLCAVQCVMRFTPSWSNERDKLIQVKVFLH